MVFNWADGDKGKRLIWEGWLDTGARHAGGGEPRRAPNMATSRGYASPDDIVIG